MCYEKTARATLLELEYIEKRGSDATIIFDVIDVYVKDNILCYTSIDCDDRVHLHKMNLRKIYKYAVYCGVELVLGKEITFEELGIEEIDEEELEKYEQIY